MKKTLTLLLLLLCLASLAFGEGNLVQNASFEDVNGTLPTHFKTDAYDRQPHVSVFKSTSEKAHSGTHSAYIKNVGKNDARFWQTLAVEPNSYYKLSGYILANAEDGKGANLSIDGVYAFSPSILNSNDKWEYVELFGQTGKNQKEVTIFARLGGYGGESKGYAYFDDIALEKVEKDDTHSFVPWFATANPKKVNSNGEKVAQYGIVIALLLAYVLFAYLLFTRLNLAFKAWHLWVMLALAFGLRLIISANYHGYGVDMGCFTGWSQAMFTHGASGFYHSGIFCDYPPAYLYVLYLNGALMSLLQPNAELVRLMVKMTPNLCDILASLLLFAVAKNNLGKPKAFILATLYAFSPVSLVSGAAWGQIDAVFTLVLALSVWCALQKREHFALPLFVLCILIKPQGLIFGPVALAYTLLNLKDQGFLKRFGSGILLAILLALAIVLPFGVKNHDLTWIFNIYQGTLTSYPYASINTANLFYLMGANWQPQGDSMPQLFVIVYTLLLFGLGLATMLHHKTALQNLKKQSKKSKKALCSYLLLAYAFAFVVVEMWFNSYQNFSTLNIVFASLLSLVLLYHLKPTRLAYVLALFLWLIYIGAVRMHERYLYPAILLFFLDYALSRDRRSLMLGLFSMPSLFLNIAFVLENERAFGASSGHLLDATLPLNIAMALYNVAFVVFALYISISNKTLPNVFAHFNQKLNEKGNKTSISHAPHGEIKPHLLKIDKKDVLIMLIISVLYACTAFYALGSTKAPQTAHVFSDEGESVVLELPKEESFNVLYFDPINYNGLTFSASRDGETWTEPLPAQMNQGQIFRWKYLTGSTKEEGKDGYRFDHVPVVLSGKYLKIESQAPGVALSEIILRKAGTNYAEAESIPFSIQSHTGYDDEVADTSTLNYIKDEPNTLEGVPSYFNSTYFDEIYHARTGFEQLHGLHPYETSHPPLGKLFMSLGIWLFGMTPFGFRFFGVAIGVAMLPVLYIMAKCLFNKRFIATFCTLLLALDCLHLTQTRIATIDSYPVFFIMLSYLFMYQYLCLPHDALPLKKRLIPLFWCGIAFGLSVASKWIGLYSGVGLAVLFFASLFKQMQGKTTNEKWQLALQTCTGCVWFFIVIPFIIYYLCYIPYFAPSGGITLSKLWNTQVHMYNYHATPGLGADHPYYSPWWQWPLILKPMWYFCGELEPEGFAQTIFAMGNPVVFYLGFVAMVLVLLALLGQFVLNLRGRGFALSLTCLVGVGFLSQFLPWVIVPRGTYIYHYFASVPFIILAVGLVFHMLLTHFKTKKVWIYALMVLILVLALVLFIGFYPYATGILTPKPWLDFMKWFPKIWY